MLIIKLEAHISQQSQQIEQERWQIQQEVARLKVREVAFEEERSNALKGFTQGQEELQKAKVCVCSACCCCFVDLDAGIFGEARTSSLLKNQPLTQSTD